MKDNTMMSSKDTGKGGMKMSKAEWIAKKIAVLVSEGKSREEAVAIANSMWQQMQRKGK